MFLINEICKRKIYPDDGLNDIYYASKYVGRIEGVIKLSVYFHWLIYNITLMIINPEWLFHYTHCIHKTFLLDINSAYGHRK